MGARCLLCPAALAASLLLGSVSAKGESRPLEAEAMASLENGRVALNQVLTYPAGNAESRLAALLEAHLDLPGLMDRTLCSYVERTLEDYLKVMSQAEVRALADASQARLAQAFRRRLIAGLATWARSGEIRSVSENRGR